MSLEPDDTYGCTGDQLVARCAEASWPNHGEYVSCVAHAANRAAALGLITSAQKSAYVRQAARSSVGQ